MNCCLKKCNTRYRQACDEGCEKLHKTSTEYSLRHLANNRISVRNVCRDFRRKIPVPNIHKICYMCFSILLAIQARSLNTGSCFGLSCIYTCTYEFYIYIYIYRERERERERESAREEGEGGRQTDRQR